METDTCVLAEIEVFDAQVGRLLHARAGVIDEQQQAPVAKREAALASQAAQEPLDLVAFEEARLGLPIPPRAGLPRLP